MVFFDWFFVEYCVEGDGVYYFCCCQCELFCDVVLYFFVQLFELVLG